VSRLAHKHPINSSLPAKTSSIRNSISKYEKVEVWGVPIGDLTRDQLTSIFLQLVKNRKRGWISYVNVHAMNLSYSIEWFHQYLQKSIMIYCDGQGLRYGAALLGKRISERIAFSEWILDVCEVAVQTGKGLYLLGATDEILEKAKRNLLHLYPTLAILGMHHGYFSDRESSSLIDLINRSGADIVVVGMGMPKQEKWIQENFARLKPHLVLNAGSCFDFVAGTKKRCPQWLGNIGLEWLFRLILEPKRLWRRYLIGNPLFIYRIIKTGFMRNS
jgi:N-acetylglucosaminyldiphosphoundecaprenol N-acetyl-beta-D-mannosaminyltransferase